MVMSARQHKMVDTDGVSNTVLGAGGKHGGSNERGSKTGPRVAPTTLTELPRPGQKLARPQQEHRTKERLEESTSTCRD